MVRAGLGRWLGAAVAGNFDGLEAANEYLKIAWYAVRHNLTQTFAGSPVEEDRVWPGR